jgi:hypothetical protein
VQQIKLDKNTVDPLENMYALQVNLENQKNKVFNRYRFLDTSALPWEKTEDYE